MTAPNPTGVQRCIRTALADAELEAGQIDAISGHLTATFADPHEVANWQQALDCSPEDLPTITATKSLIGHALGAAGAIESRRCGVDAARGLHTPGGHCDDLHEDIEPYAASVPHTVKDTEDLNFIVRRGSVLET